MFTLRYQCTAQPRALSAATSSSANAGRTASILGATYLGSPPSSSGQPTLWRTQNNGSVTATYTETLSLPFSYSLTAGQAATALGAALWATGDASGAGTMNGISWLIAGVAFTSRTSW